MKRTRFPATYSFNVNENVGTGTAVGTVAATDIDSAGVAFGQQRYYFWNGSATSATSSDGRFAINATTGVITVNSALNFEAGATSVNYNVVARDNAGRRRLQPGALDRHHRHQQPQ